MTSGREKKLFLFESNKVLNKKVIEHILQRDPNPSIVVLENYAEKSNFSTPIKSISDYYDLQELRDRVDEICTSTLKSLLEDPTINSAFTIDGIFYLKLIREDLGSMLSGVIRNVLAVERIISEEKPSKIVVFESHNFLTATLPIPLGRLVTPIAKKHFVNVSVKFPTLSRWILRVKIFLAPIYFLKKRFKVYTLVRIKSLFWSDLRKRSKEHVDVRRKKVLFIPYSNAEKISMEPIVERLCNSEEIDCVAIPYPDDDERAGLLENQWKKRKNKIPTFSFGEYHPRDSLAIRKCKEVMELWRRKKQLFCASEALKLDGINLGEIIKEKFDVVFKCWMKECVRYFFVAKEIIRREKPDIVLTAKSRWMWMRSVLEAVRQEGIPSILIQHGIYYDSFLWDPVNVTKICVDDDFRNILVKRGEDPEKIIVTGAPRYDRFFKKMKENINDIKRRLGLNPNKKYMCLLTSFLPEWSTAEKHDVLLSTLIDSAKEVNYDLIIKLHPRENKMEVQDLISRIDRMKEYGNRIVIFSFEEAHLSDVVLASDIIIGVRTSALINALLAKKPTILINFDPSVSDFFPEIQGKIFGVARSPTELFEIIKDAVANPSKAKDSVKRAEKYARKYVPYKNATDRVVSCLLELLENI